MEEDNKLKLEERVKKILSIITDDYGRADVNFLIDMEYPFIVEVRETEDILDPYSVKTTKIEIEDIDNLEKSFKSLPGNCEVRIVGLVSTMILKCREDE